MNNPVSFYNTQLKKYKEKAITVQKSLTTISLIRLSIFVLTVVGIYYSLKRIELALFIGVLGLSIFLFLLKKYSKLKVSKKLFEAIITINEDELKINSGDYFDRNQGLEHQDAKHFYSFDIDLFGRGSFYQYINRTSISEGSKRLAAELKANKINDIVLRQNAIKDLSEKAVWRQKFSAIASLITIETSENSIVEWLKNYQVFLSKTMQRFLLLFGSISVVLIGLSFASIITPFPVIIWMLFGLMITGIHLQNISKLATNSDKVKQTFRQYSQLLKEIESIEFSSEILILKQQKITSEEKKASLIFDEFSKLLDALDNRNNILFAILSNGFFLWDIKQSYKIEQWIKQYATKVEDWFEVLSFFDAYNSLGNFAFNHPTYVYPEITTNKTAIFTKQLGHPLLKIAKRIDNDLVINNEQFFIVTGANMAGKSTFLRTVSIAIVMSNVGLPICAEQSSYSPIKLITSMRTSDSLTDDSSYFFSELTRLKLIVDAIQNEPYFIILDEILKGTNSTDKAIGSRKFVEKLVASNATGIIATHDLSLCDVAQELDNVENYYFDASIINDELYFDYTFKKGICKNMNASFLLRKMEII